MYSFFFAILGPFLSLFSGLTGCSPDFKDLSTANGRRAVIEQAQNYITIGNCEDALTIVKPLYESSYVDYEIRMTYASAYACQGGFSFPSLIGALADASGTDIWSKLVLSDYSKDSGDGKLTALRAAADIVRATTLIPITSPVPYYDARYRQSDANLYMVFLQATIVALVISPTNLGNAYPASGKKGQAISGLGTNSEKCMIQNALTTLSNSMSYASSSGSSLSKIGSSITSLCGAAGCSGTLDPTVCNAAEVATGAAFIVGIDNQWTQGP